MFKQNETCLAQPLAGAAYQAEAPEPPQSKKLLWTIIVFSLCILVGSIIFIMKKEKSEFHEAMDELRKYSRETLKRFRRK